MKTTAPQPVSQPVDAMLTPSAIFLVLTVNSGRQAEETVRGVCADLSSLKRGVGFRNLNGQLSCVMGIGSDLWDRLFGAPRPKHLRPMREIRGVHFAPSTPGDILLHIRSTRFDMCFELATAVMNRLAGVVDVIDEVHGFKFFDERDLLGFVDGTENPEGQAAVAATIIGDEDPEFTGGSYVIIQKYLHDLAAWNGQSVETQEDIIGRHKLSDIEQLDSRKKPYAHNVLTSINDASGQPLQILRDNMPFGEVGKGEFGTFFIGYARDPAVTERMLDNMFIGSPPGNYDRLLDFSVAKTGCLFFVPTATFLDGVTVEGSIAAATDPPSLAETDGDDGLGDGSLKIGSLKK